MAVRWFFHQYDERRIKAHSLGSAAPLQKEEGLNSFGPATILINNSIPHSHTESETDKRERGREFLYCVVASHVFCRNIRKIGSSLITLYFCHLQLFSSFFENAFLPYLIVWDSAFRVALCLTSLASSSAGTYPALCCPLCFLWFLKAAGLKGTFPWIKRMISLASMGVRFHSRD